MEGHEDDEHNYEEGNQISDSDEGYDDGMGGGLERQYNQGKQAMGKNLNKAKNMKGNLSKQAKNLKNKGMGQINDMKGNAMGQFNDVTGNAMGQFNDAKGNAMGQFNNMKGNAMGQVNNLKGNAMGKFNDAKGNAMGQFNDAKGNAMGQFDEYKNQATGEINKYKDMAGNLQGQGQDYMNNLEGNVMGQVGDLQGQAMGRFGAEKDKYMGKAQEYQDQFNDAKGMLQGHADQFGDLKIDGIQDMGMDKLNAFKDDAMGGLAGKMGLSSKGPVKSKVIGGFGLNNSDDDEDDDEDSEEESSEESEETEEDEEYEGDEQEEGMEGENEDGVPMNQAQRGRGARGRGRGTTRGRGGRTNTRGKKKPAKKKKGALPKKIPKGKRYIDKIGKTPSQIRRPKLPAAMMIDSDIEGLEDVDDNVTKEIIKNTKEYKWEKDKNWFQNVWRDIMYKTHKFQRQGESLYFYFFMLKFFMILFFIICCIEIPVIILNGHGHALENRTKVDDILKFSFANRGFDRENSSQFYDFEALLRKNAIRQGFLDNIVINKASNQNKADKVAAGSGSARRLQDDATKETETDTNTTPKSGETPTQTNTNTRKIVDGCWVVPEPITKNQIEYYWEHQFRDYWDEKWNEDFEKKYAERFTQLDGIKDQKIYPWNQNKCQTDAEDIYNIKVVGDKDLDEYIGTFFKAINAEDNSNNDAETTPAEETDNADATGGDANNGESGTGTGSGSGTDDTADNSNNGSGGDDSAFQGTRLLQLSGDSGSGSGSGSSSTVGTLTTGPEEDLATEERLASYTKIIGDSSLATLWLKDKWLYEKTEAEVLKFLSPFILTDDEQEQKELYAKERPVLRLYFQELTLPIFKTEAKFKAYQFKKRIAQIENILYVKDQDKNEILRLHRETVLQWLDRYNPEKNNVAEDSYNDDLAWVYWFQMSMDCLSSIIFIFGIYLFQYLMRRKMKYFQRTQSSVMYYSIRASGFPVYGTSVAELKKYFNKFSDVKSINPIYDFEQSLHNAKKVQKTMIQIEKIQNHPDKFDTEKSREIIKIYDIMRRNNRIKKAKMSGKKETQEVLGYVITFNNIEKRELVFNAFEEAYTRNPLEFFHMKRERVDKRFLFRRKYKLKISKMDHPENVLWENMEFKKKQRRKVIAWALLPLVLMIFLGMVLRMYFMVWKKDSLPIVCTRDIPKTNFSLLQRYISDNIIKQDIAIECFCDNHQLKGNWVMRKIFQYKKVMGQDETDVCTQMTENAWQDLLQRIIKTLMIFFMNLFINHWIFQKTKQFRLIDETRAQVFSIQLSVFAQFINTVITTLLLYMDFGGFNMMNFINDFFGFNLDLTSFEPIDNLGFDWYLLIASQFVGPFFCQAVIVFQKELRNFTFGAWYEKIYVPLFQCCLRGMFKPIRWCIRRTQIRWRYKTDQVSKKEYKKLTSQDCDTYANGDPMFKKMPKERVKTNFNLGQRYALILAFMIIVFPFSGPIPLMYVVVFLTFFITFWLHKFHMLHYFKLKRRYNSSLIRYILDMFKYILIIKLVITLWLFPRGEIYPGDKKLETIYEIKEILNHKVMWVQIKRAYPVFGVLVIVIVMLFAEEYVFRFIDTMFKKCFDAKEEETKSYVQVLSAMKQMKSGRPSNYNIDKNIKYVTLQSFDVEMIRPLKIHAVLAEDKTLVDKLPFKVEKSVKKHNKYADDLFKKAKKKGGSSKKKPKGPPKY